MRFRLEAHHLALFRVFSAFALLFAAVSAAAQDSSHFSDPVAQSTSASASVSTSASTNSHDRDAAKNSLSIFTAGTLTNTTFFGKAADRHLFLLGARYTRTLRRTQRSVFSYTADILPLALLSQPFFNGFEQLRSFPPLTHNEISYGGGASPVGVEWKFRPERKWQPIVGVNGGFLYFQRNVPTTFSAQFNFTAYARVGLSTPVRDGKTFSFGYIFHHLSNGYTAHENFGMDSHMLFATYGFNFRR